MKRCIAEPPLLHILRPIYYMRKFIIFTDLSRSHLQAELPLRFLVSLMCLVALFEYNFLNASIFPKAIHDYQTALGDNALTKLPDITQVVLAFQSSTLWHLSPLLALVIMLLVWLLRPA